MTRNADGRAAVGSVVSPVLRHVAASCVKKNIYLENSLFFSDSLDRSPRHRVVPRPAVCGFNVVTVMDFLNSNPRQARLVWAAGQRFPERSTWK